MIGDVLGGGELTRSSWNAPARSLASKSQWTFVKFDTRHRSRSPAVRCDSTSSLAIHRLRFGGDPSVRASEARRVGGFPSGTYHEILVYGVPSIDWACRHILHELAHAAQWERHGFAFPKRYEDARLDHGYEDNPFEIEARLAEMRAYDDEGDPDDPDRRFAKRAAIRIAR